MAQPDPYARQFDYTALAPADYPAAGSRINIDIDGLSATTNEVIANLALIQRDDGEIRNQSVLPETLNPATRLLIAGSWTLKGNWTTGVAYGISDVVRADPGTGAGLYVALSAHTAGTFATDLAAFRWILLYNDGAAPFTTSVYMQGVVSAADAAAARTALGAAAAASPSFTGTANFAGQVNAPSLYSTGPVTSATSASEAALIASAPATYRASLQFQRGAPARWRLGMDATVETGLNAGGDLDLFRYTDAGAVNGAAVVSVNRATGVPTWGYQNSFIAGTAAAPGVRVGTAQNGLAEVGANTLGLVANGVEIARVSSAGIAMQDAADSFDGKNTAKAWVRFNGTGVIAIANSFNVTSITDGGAGIYTINFTSAIPASAAGVTGVTVGNTLNPTAAVLVSISTTAAVINAIELGAYYDSGLVSFIAFG